MDVAHPQALRPRKTPRQARSEATVDAVFQATIQVLLNEGPRRLTTTRVAMRAGVSVGTMYQYFPHKQALLYAVLQRHLDGIAEAVEAACARHWGQPITVMSDGLVAAYIDAKTRDVEASRALYLVSAELDTAELIGGTSKRILAAATELLASAPATTIDNLTDVSFAMMAALAGAVRITFERGAAPEMVQALRTQLAAMCRAYVQAAAQVGRNTVPAHACVDVVEPGSTPLV